MHDEQPQPLSVALKEIGDRVDAACDEFVHIVRYRVIWVHVGSTSRLKGHIRPVKSQSWIKRTQHKVIYLGEKQTLLVTPTASMKGTYPTNFAFECPSNHAQIQRKGHALP